MATGKSSNQAPICIAHGMSNLVVTQSDRDFSRGKNLLVIGALKIRPNVGIPHQSLIDANVAEQHVAEHLKPDTSIIAHQHYLDEN